MQSDNFQIRRADREDVEQLGRLQESVCGVHADGCPDLFRLGGRKYNNESLARMIEDHSSLIYVAEDGNGYLMEHVFYQINNLTLNVWTCNPSAIRFYEQCGMSVYKMGMETNLQYQ